MASWFQRNASRVIMSVMDKKAISPLINLYNYRSGLIQQVPLTVGQPAVYPTVETMTWIKAYKENASVYTVVTAIAQKFGYMPRYVYEIVDDDAADEYKRITRRPGFDVKSAKKLKKKAYKPFRKKSYSEQIIDSPLSDLLNKPNERDGQDSFFMKVDISYDLTGEAFVWLNRGLLSDGVEGDARLKMPILEMWVLPSQFMAVNVDRQDYVGEILSYIFIKSGIQYAIPKEDIIHWVRPNPDYDSYNYAHLRGLSPLAPGRKLFTADDAAMDALVAMHQNGGTKGVLTNPGNTKLTWEQSSKLDDVIDTKINNRSLRGAVVQVPGDWNYLDMSMNAVDMDLLESQDKMLERICNLYGINPNFFVSGATFDNLSQARKDFVTQTVLPRACSFRDEFNRMVLMAFNYDPKMITTDIDVSSLPELQEDMQKMVTALNQAWWFTGNEKRVEMNEEEMDDPNMDKIIIGSNMILLDDIAPDMSAINTYLPNGNKPNPGEGDDSGSGGQTVSVDGNGVQAGEGNENGSAGKLLREIIKPSRNGRT